MFLGSRNRGRYSDQRSKQGESLGVKGAVAPGLDLLGPCGRCKDRLLGRGSGAVRDFEQRKDLLIRAPWAAVLRRDWRGRSLCPEFGTG